MKLTPELRALLAERSEQVPFEMPPGTYAVYTLTDPTTHTIRYVGITHRPRARLAQHLHVPLARNKKHSWVAHLAQHGEIPIMTIVETVTGTKQDAEIREQAWIEKLARAGSQLVNREVSRDSYESSGVEDCPPGMTDYELSPEVLIPVEQMTVAFGGHPLVVVRLADGRVCVILRGLFAGLGLDFSGQLDRIKRKSALVEGLVYVRAQTPGGAQSMPALTLDVLPGWCLTVDENRLNELK